MNIRVLLERYFDPNILDLIDDQELSKIQNKLLTIVFWDISKFSDLCNLLKAYPQRIAEFIREYSRVASEIIFHNKGVLDKYIGDGVMAWFGLQSRDEKGKNDAINALNAAFEFRDRFNKELRPKWIAIWNSDIAERIPDIRLKCGIHTGEAIIGNLGTENRDQFTAIGPNVNLSSRLEGIAEGDQIIISTTTKSRVCDHFTCVQIKHPKEIQGFPDVKEYFEVKPVNLS